MKRILRLLFLYVAIIFITGCVSGKEIISDNKLKRGMSKNEFGRKFIMSSVKEYVFMSSAGSYKYGNKEIIWPPSKSVFYVFTNVTRPVKCNFICDRGDGEYDTYFTSLSAAKNYIQGSSIKKQKKKELVVKKSNSNTSVGILEILIKDYKIGKIDKVEFERRKKILLND